MKMNLLSFDNGHRKMLESGTEELKRCMIVDNDYIKTLVDEYSKLMLIVDESGLVHDIIVTDIDDGYMEIIHSVTNNLTYKEYAKIIKYLDNKYKYKLRFTCSPEDGIFKAFLGLKHPSKIREWSSNMYPITTPLFHELGLDTTRELVTNMQYRRLYLSKGGVVFTIKHTMSEPQFTLNYTEGTTLCKISLQDANISIISGTPTVSDTKSLVNQLLGVNRFVFVNFGHLITEFESTPYINSVSNDILKFHKKGMHVQN